MIKQINYAIGISPIQRGNIDIIEPNPIFEILLFSLNEISFRCIYMLSLFSISEF